MHNLYIVDDDPLVTKGLSINIPWKEYNISVAGIAANGLDALDVMSSKIPDIVISDVKMPKMDGIELANIIHNKYPKTRIIILSAHDELSYVHDALSLRVVDYLLKPIDNTSILDAVLKAASEIDSDNILETNLNEHLPIMQQMFLNRLAEGYYKDEDSVLEQVRFLGLPLTQGSFISAAIKLDDPDYFGNSARDHELIKFALRNIIEESSSIRLNTLVYNPSGDVLGLIFYSSDSFDNRASFTSEVKMFLENLLELVHVHMKTTVTIGYGNCYQGFLGIYRSQLEASSAIKYSHLTGTNYVYPANSVRITLESSLVEYNKFIEELINKVLTFAIDEAYLIIDEISQELKNNLTISIDYLKMLFSEITFALIREARKNFSERAEFGKINIFEYYKNINKANTLDSMILYLKKLVAALIDISSAGRISSKTIIVSQAVKYLTDNFCDDSLSLQKVAMFVNVSPIYLSLIFKKEKGINFIVFLFNLRMNKAIELLRNNDYKAYELAEKVGFTNPNYFGMCFKRFTGYTLSQWKERANASTL